MDDAPRDGLGDGPSGGDDRHLVFSPRSALYRRSRGLVHAGGAKRIWGGPRIRILNARLAQMDRTRAVMVLSTLSLMPKS